jgi:hypothetical protein
VPYGVSKYVPATSSMQDLDQVQPSWCGACCRMQRITMYVSLHNAFLNTKLGIKILMEES